MTKGGQGRRRLPSDASGAQFSIFGLILGGAFVFFSLLYHLLQPTVVANPGLAAFSPPLATRLVPLPRQSDAPALAEQPDEPAAPLKAFAQADSAAPAASAETKPDAKPPARKRPRASAADSRSSDPRFYEPRRPEFAQQWNFGFSDWGAGNRTSRGEWSASSHVWRGGPRSAF